MVKGRKERVAMRRRRVNRKLQKNGKQRPILLVRKSIKHIYAILIEAESGRVITAAVSKKKNSAAAQELGRIIAEKATAAGYTELVFNRGGYPYHGRVKALAEAAREAGLKF